MKVLYITTDWNTPYRIATGEYGGVGYYRAHGPAKALRARGHRVDVMGKDLVDHIDENDIFNSYVYLFEQYDLVVIKQADTINVAKLIGACKEAGVPIAMDLDDLITELDPDNPATELGYAKGEAKQAFAIASLTMMDALFVSTQPLADEYKKYLKEAHRLDMPVFVLPNCIDPTMWSKMRRKPDTNIVVGWQGSITHDHDLALVVPTMQKLMKTHQNLVLSLTGGVRQETYDEMFAKVFDQDALDRIIVNKGTQSYKNFPQYMARHQWDIGIIPLKNTKFTRCKSHIKWMENSLLGVPSIASDIYPYREAIQGTPVITDNVTGLLARDNEWEDKLEILIADEKKRRYLARDARNYVMDNWTYPNHVSKWEEAFTCVVDEGSKSLRK